jgi:anti-sigma regulatory factor (Ser/Thr protein kinase)
MLPPDSSMPPQDRIRARPQGDFVFSLEPDPHAPAEARRRLCAALPAGLPQELLDDILLLTTELVTNSVRHAPTVPAGSVDVSVCYLPTAIRVEVADDGAGFSHVPQRPGRLAEGGRGLFLVEVLADRWGMADADNTTVWYELDIEREEAAWPTADARMEASAVGASASVQEVPSGVRGVVSQAELATEAGEIAADLHALGSSTQSLDRRSRAIEADLERVTDTLKAGAERLRAREKVHPAPDEQRG